jgi:hypothetical protein
MGEVWIPEAEDLKAAGSSGTMSGVGPPRAICHVTVSPSGGSWFDAMHKVLIGKKAEPHLLYDPRTDRLGQYFPLNRSARALMNGGKEISHNKVGPVCIQVEFVAQPDGFTRYWQPGPNFRAMMRAIGSWGVQSEFVARLPKSGSDNVRQSWSTYKTTGGWWGHCHVPSPETHWDPGPIDTAAFFAEAGVKPAPAPVAPQEDDMPTPEEIAAAVWSHQLAKPGNVNTENAGSQLGKAHIYAYRNNAQAAALAAQVEALNATVGVLANSQGLDANLVQKTIADAVAAAMSRLKITTAETA